jgi:hypothetical protein
VIKKFKEAPVAYLVTAMSVLLAVLVYLQGTGLVTGTAATWLTVAVGIIQVLLGFAVRAKVTPVANPKDNLGRRLVPAQIVPGRGTTQFRPGTSSGQ